MQLKKRLASGCASFVALSTALFLASAAHAEDQSTARATTTPAPSDQSVTSTSTETPDTATAGLGEIVVTARRQAENIMKTPVAVSAYTGANIQALVVNNVQDLNKLSPG